MTGKTLSERFSRVSIRSIIYLYFTISALTALVLMGISFYGRLVSQMTSVIQEENQTMLAQVNHSVDSYLRTIMKLSDSLYYDVIKNADLSDESIHSELNLLYDSSRDYVSNIALFSKDGELVDTVPAARIKTDLDVTKEEWFSDTLERTENLHFTMPHVQYIFDNDENQYTWVITLTRAVELTRGVSTEQGILLIDITYGSLKQLLDSITMGNHGYLYMISSGGQLIYHPQMQLIDAGQLEENIQAAVGYRDGNYRESYQGRIRDVTVKSVGYTGWKLVGVTPEQDSYLNTLKTKLFMVFLVGLFLLILMIINASISSRITVPIRELEKSVNALETGNLDAEVYQGGSYEIRHLGRSIGDMAKQIKVLMQDIVAEHESKRKSEFDTLQSQINPHFLYNTLDIIVWMIENEKQADAVKVVTALARFFRISLSRGKSIITVRDEIEHVRNYLTIQHMRFKNRFTYEIEADEEVMDLASVKLILQPLVENAIYHGMEFMDGDGEIRIRVYRDGDDLYMKVSDNGLGMTTEQIEKMFSDRKHVASKSGSGIGVRNVNERIRLYFGMDYGLSIESELDEGTTVTIHMKAIPYAETAEGEKINVK